MPNFNRQKRTFPFALVKGITLQDLGCWKDDSDRAINSQKFSVNKNSAVSQCQQLAIERGFNVFTVENDDVCFTASDAGDTYKRHGPVDNCNEIICKFVHYVSM